MAGAPFTPSFLLLKGRVTSGSFSGTPNHGFPQSEAKRGALRTRAALQGLHRLVEAPGEATFTRLPLLLPPPLPWARLPAVTRDSPPGSKAAARGRRALGAPRPPFFPGWSRPSGEALATASSQPPCPRARGGGTWARGVRGASAPGPLTDRPPHARARPVPQPPRAEPCWRAPRPAQGQPRPRRPCARSLPSP